MTVRRRACPRFLTGLLTLALAAGAGRPCPAAEEKSLPAGLALVPRDGVFFASVRVADLLRSEPGKQLLARLRKEPDTTALAAELEKELGVPLADVERLTLMPPRTLIVRTARPYDREKVLGRLAPRGRRQKYGGRTFYQDEGGGAVVYLADERVYLKTRAVFAHLLTQFLDRAARGGPGPLADALEQAAGRHHVVAAITPLALLPVRLDDRTAPRRGGAPRLGEDPAVRFSLKDLIDNLPVEFLPFKPLLRARVGVLVADLGEESKLEARVVFPDKDAAQDGETAIRTGLYVLRELLPRVYSGARLAGAGPEKSPPPLLRQVRASLKNAVVATRGPVVTVSARFRVDAAAVGTLAAQVALAAGRTRAINDLKQIGLAMHNFAAAFQYLPPPAVCGKDGKPLLSWRVALLPYLDEGKLYKEFKLDEPWDSPHNKKLLEKMPRVYAPVRGKTRQPYSTYYQVFVGREAPFQVQPARGSPFGAWGPRFPATFTDGTSNTLLVAEAAEAVPWTKPEDLPFDAKKPPPGLGAQFPGGFLACMADGSVHFLPRNLDDQTLRRLIMPADGNPIDWDRVERGGGGQSGGPRPKPRTETPPPPPAAPKPAPNPSVTRRRPG